MTVTRSARAVADQRQTTVVGGGGAVRADVTCVSEARGVRVCVTAASLGGGVNGKMTVTKFLDPSNSWTWKWMNGSHCPYIGHLRKVPDVGGPVVVKSKNAHNVKKCFCVSVFVLSKCRNIRDYS